MVFVMIIFYILYNFLILFSFFFISLFLVVDLFDDVYLIILKVDFVFSVDRFKVFVLWLMVIFLEWNK